MSTHQYPPKTASQRLSKAEQVTLAILIGDAFKEFLRMDPGWLSASKAMGFTRAKLESNWRHGQIKHATSRPEPHPAGIIDGLSKASRAHWECLAAHFCALLGRDVQSFKHTLRDGPAPRRAGKDADLQSDLRQARQCLADEMATRGINEAYIATIIAGKFHQRTLGTLTKNEVWQVYYTIRNRANQRDGRGDAENRNKSQRAAHLQRLQRTDADPANRMATADADDVGF